MWDSEIIVARHGETDWNREGKWQGSSDMPLNSRGEEQARQLALKLGGEGIRYIFSSDMKRAKTTAGIVARNIGAIEVLEDARLKERNLGKFEGWSIYQVASYMGMPESEAHSLDVDELAIDGIPTVEGWETFKSRVWEALEEIRDRCLGSRCLIVAHGGVLRAITMQLNTGKEARVVFENTDFIRLRSTGGSWEISDV